MSVSRHGDKFDPQALYRECVDVAFAGVRETVHAVEAEWKRLDEPHRRTGDALRHITSEFERRANGGEGNVGTSDKAALYREEGTGEYGPKHRRIVPLRARALSWVGGPNATLAGRQRKGTKGGRVFVRFVRGIRPQHVFEDTIRAVTPRLDQIAERTEAKIAARFARGR